MNDLPSRDCFRNSMKHDGGLPIHEARCLGVLWRASQRIVSAVSYPKGAIFLVAEASR